MIFKKLPLLSKIGLILFLFLTNKIELQAQSELQFSQYTFNTLYINPAYSGFHGQLNMTAFYRNQWVGFPGSPKTFSASADAPISDHSSLGLQAYSDAIGVQNSQSLQGLFSYRIQVGSSNFLAFGLGLGISQINSNAYLYTPSDPLDPNLSINYKASTVNSRFGLFYHNARYYLGLSATNLYARRLSSSDNSIKGVDLSKTYYLTGGVYFPISSVLGCKPSLLIKNEEKYGVSGDLNAYLIFYGSFWIGGSYRSGLFIKNSNLNSSSLSASNAYVISTQVFIGERLRIGYSVDIPQGSLQTSKSFSHEFALGYTFPKTKKQADRDRSVDGTIVF